MRTRSRTVALGLLLNLYFTDEYITKVKAFQPYSIHVRKSHNERDLARDIPCHLESIPIRNFHKRINNQRRRCVTANSVILFNSSKKSSSEEVSRDGELKRSSLSLLQDQDTEHPWSKFATTFENVNFPQLGLWESDNKSGDDKSEQNRLRMRDLIKSLFRRLANLSLQDYYWRSDLFKKTQADRQIEESLARMMGEDAAYVRPMDAGNKIGPLGRAEKTIVEWLSLVIEEEGRRARLISNSEGELVRPMDAEKGGPLASLENGAVDFLNSIRDSEKERVKTLTLRPKDVEVEKRGPLGNFEARVVNALDEIRSSEKLRMEQSKRRGGEIVRPIDVPGPLGEAERWYLELITAEKQRGKDRDRNDGKLVRPKDASITGPLGIAERQFSDAMNVVKDEETERLKNIQRLLREKRPMENDRDSPLGFTEAFMVGAFRAPQMLFRVIDRVKELLESEKLNIDNGDSVEKNSKK
mmetsp:Transcript_25109/g.28723  ORF Transcript_25109/g.28723 Transcript_25109/m.28723 type:complete len:470 (+) Transcript_25109:132-1541(+)